ncbi:MAG TPA: efflux RND transporter periplasmic adaptor subunit [Polyangiaceae bacterium]|nr:efflux RND transporter periplasmic adaptor subunit [Polyangiaceae bacterium]
MKFLTLLKRTALYAVPVVLFAGVAVLFVRMRTHRTLTDSDYARDHGAPLPVRVFRVDDAPLNQSIPAECTTRPNPLVEVRGRVAGRTVLATHVKVGQKVKKGTLLVSLDDKPERLAIQTASERVSSYQRVVGENTKLVDYYKGVRDEGVGLERDLRVASVELAKAQAELARAEVEVKTGQSELEFTRVISSVDGVVMTVAMPGEASLPDTPLASVAAIDPIMLECALPEEKLAFVKPGATMHSTFQGRPGEAFQGVIKDIDALGRERERVLTLRVEVPNPNGVLLPGLHGVGEIKNEQKTLRIPSVALLNPRADLAQVFAIEGANKARLRKIGVGASAGGYVQVVHGLAAGDQVVVAGQLGLREGDNVRVTEDAPQGATK